MSYNLGFEVWPRLKFGDIEVDCTFKNTVRAMCPVPESKKVIGKVPIFISLNGVDWHDSGFFYTFYSEPKIKFIRPTTGTTDGGTVIELHGKNFIKDVPKESFNCRFSLSHDPSTFKIVPAHYQSDEVVICMSPGGWEQGAGTDVDLTLNGRDYTSGGENKFYFYQIDDILPRCGPAGSKDAFITVIGSGFKPDKLAGLFINQVESPAS